MVANFGMSDRTETALNIWGLTQLNLIYTNGA